MKYFFLVTSILGLIRNYIKYKELKLLLFLRTPILCEFIFYFVKFKTEYKYAILISIIFERWLMLIIKSFLSYIKDDYNIKKEKYKNKYNLKYKNN